MRKGALAADEPLDAPGKASDFDLQAFCRAQAGRHRVRLLRSQLHDDQATFERSDVEDLEAGSQQRQEKEDRLLPLLQRLAAHVQQGTVGVSAWEQRTLRRCENWIQHHPSLP